jgi:hypothetical protein
MVLAFNHASGAARSPQPKAILLQYEVVQVAAARPFTVFVVIIIAKKPAFVK